jgi:hypothetical protein
MNEFEARQKILDEWEVDRARRLNQKKKGRWLKQCYFYLYSKIPLSLVLQIVSFLPDSVGIELKDYWDLVTLRKQILGEA